VTLLFVSLVACLLPRSRASGAMRAPPVHAQEIDGFTHYEEARLRADAATTANAARAVLRRRRFRVAADAEGRAFAADKGALRELGSLVFHWAFVLLLIGVVIGKGTGYSGRAAVVEGETWTDADPLRPAHLRLGQFFGGDFSGLGIRLLRYEDAYDQTTGLPWTSCPHWNWTAGRRGQAGPGAGQPSGPPRSPADLPVRVRVGAGGHGDR
jgi:cytochrome c biogenesis protein